MELTRLSTGRKDRRDYAPAQDRHREELTDRERRLLEDLEERIRGGFRAYLTYFHNVGEALWTIRWQRLFREKYDDFDEYCWATWKFTASRGRQITDAWDAFKDIEDICPPEAVPQTERALRVLVHLASKEERRQVWAKAIEINPKKHRPPTYESVKQALDVTLLTPMKNRPRSAPEKEITTIEVANGHHQAALTWSPPPQPAPAMVIVGDRQLTPKPAKVDLEALAPRLRQMVEIFLPMVKRDCATVFLLQRLPRETAAEIRERGHDALGALRDLITVAEQRLVA